MSKKVTQAKFAIPTSTTKNMVNPRSTEVSDSTKYSSKAPTTSNLSARPTKCTSKAATVRSQTTSPCLYINKHSEHMRKRSSVSESSAFKQLSLPEAPSINRFPYPFYFSFILGVALELSTSLPLHFYYFLL